VHLTATGYDHLAHALAERYRIERELGRGGMATVYLAEDIRHHRAVAIKVLHPELGAWLGAERFNAEIRITARLQHPHILPLLDSGQVSAAPGVSDELLYYVMPYVTGETLRDRLRREQQLTVDDALRITKELAAALAYAHAQGIIHRDIKPENILLGPPNAVPPGPALLADFGVARSLDGAGDRLTSTGLTVGTAAYMSPEQATAERELDGRSDTYSLGCVLYEMLAGEPPFTGPNPRAILAKQLADPVRPVRRMREGVPPHVDAALARALARSPADRFADAVAFASALDAPAVTRRPIGTRIIGVGVGALAVAVAAWTALSRPRTALGMPSVRIERFTTSAADTASAYLAATLQQDVTAALAESRSARVFTMDSARLPSGFAVAATAGRVGDSVEIRLNVVRDPSGEFVGTALVRRPVRDVHELPGLATDHLLRLIGQPRAVRSTAAPSPSTRDSIAYDLFLRGRYQTDRRTEQSTQRAVQLFQAAVKRDSNFAEGWAGLARALRQAQGRGFRIPAIPADSVGPFMLEASDRALEADSARSYVWLARGLVLAGIDPTNLRSRILAHERAIALDSSNADAWFYLGGAWEDSLVPSRALFGSRNALRNDPTHRQALGFMALHFMWARQYDSAVAWGETGKRIDPTHILIRQGLSMAELLRGDTSRAGDDFRAEMRISLGRDEGFGWAGLADIAARQGNRTAADTLIRHALAMIDTLHPTVHEAAYAGWALAAVGDKTRAIRLLERYEPRNATHYQFHLLRDPFLDPLRSMPAFTALLVRKDQARGPGS
jgi:tRNA A-37 threonylcarbamoyl transferase component Bud32